MSQPIKNKKVKNIDSKKSHKPKIYKRKHQEYGTSKLEERFSREFLDRLGIKYTYQFKAEDIGRYYDFKIENGPIIEIQGGYWHGDPRLYEEKDLNETQKHAQYVDALKEKWALMHGIPIYYIWEKDINESPEKVRKLLIEILNKKEKMDNKKKRH